jgi:hypothetical protein
MDAPNTATINTTWHCALNGRALLQKGKTMNNLKIVDDERRAPMGLAAQDQCPACLGPITRTDASGLCWSCMPCSLASKSSRSRAAKPRHTGEGFRALA